MLFRRLFIIIVSFSGVLFSQNLVASFDGDSYGFLPGDMTLCDESGITIGFWAKFDENVSGSAQIPHYIFRNNNLKVYVDDSSMHFSTLTTSPECNI